MTHQNRSTGATCAHEEETRNEKKKERDRNFTVVIWVLAETIYDFGQKWNFAWWVVFGGSSKVQVSSRSIQQFPWCGGGVKIHTIALAIHLYNSLYYRTSRDSAFNAL